MRILKTEGKKKRDKIRKKKHSVRSNKGLGFSFSFFFWIKEQDNEC